jgi:hypothetical protein
VDCETGVGWVGEEALRAGPGGMPCQPKVTSLRAVGEMAICWVEGHVRAGGGDGHMLGGEACV